MIKYVFLDMDGTLVDSERYYTDGTYRYMKEDFNYKGPKEAVYEIIGTSMYQTGQIIKRLLKSDLSVEEILSYNDRFFGERMSLDYSEYIFKEVRESLKELKEMGLKLALCSGSSKELMYKFIKSCDIEGIDYIISTDECQGHKPDPDIYLKALAFFKAQRSEVIVFEDSTSGIKAAKNAGLYTAARKDKRFGIDQSEADVKLDDMMELVRLIREINNG